MIDLAQIPAAAATLLLAIGVFIASGLIAAWVRFVSIPHLRRERELRAQSCCTDCTNPLPQGDLGPMCGECWGRNFPA